MRICILGAYEADYPRHKVIKKGLQAENIDVVECSLPPKYKFWLRYPLLFIRYLRFFGKHDFFLVPEFCQKDIPLAEWLSLFTGKKIIFDPLASRYETKILDWKRKPVHSIQARWNFRIDKWAFRFSDLILADTQAHKDYYCQDYRLSPEKVEVLPVGFDSDLFRPDEQDRNRDSFTILFFSSFLPLHGADVIIQAASILERMDQDIHFRIIGSGQTFPSVQKLAKEHDLKNIQFIPWIPQRDLPGWIASSDICLGIFGKTEKAKRVVPHKIFQSMAMGKPVITLRTPAVEEFFIHEKHIYLCEASNPDQLAEMILVLKQDNQLREKIALAGCQEVWERYSPSAIGRRFLKIIRDHFG